MHHKNRRSPTLTVTLLLLLALLYGYGFYLKGAVFQGNPLYEEVPVPALPAIYHFDKGFRSQLAANAWHREEEEQESASAVSLSAKTTVPMEPMAPVSPIEEPEEQAESGGEQGEETAERTDVPVEDAKDPETEDGEMPRPVRYRLDKADADYFNDALFIGDSRTVGLSLYAAFPGADYFAVEGMTVFSAFETTAKDGKTKLDDLFGEDGRTYGKIYVMLGINEIGTSFSSLIRRYEAVIDRLRELSPASIVVIQGNLAVTKEKSEETWYLTAQRVHELNGMMEDLADGERVFYLDPNEIFCDEDGYLKKDLSGDGVHLYAKYYADWTAWMMDHAYVPEE